MSVASALKCRSAGSRPMGGYKRRVLTGELRWMLLRLEECPHLTVRGLALELAERGYRVSPNTVWSLLRKAGHTPKRKSTSSRATFLPRIVRMVWDAQRSRAPIQRLADQVAGWFVPGVLVVAATASVFWGPTA